MRVFLTSLLAALLLVSLVGCTITDPEDVPPTQSQQEVTPQDPVKPTESASAPEAPADSIELEYGDLVSLTDNRDSGGVVVVNAKVYPLPNGSFLVDQNYYNVIDLIQNQGFDNCEIQYWAVADIDGNEIKVISFTMPIELVSQVITGGDMATQLSGLVEDLYIHEKLK